MKAALILVLFSVLPAMFLSAVSEDSFSQTYASSTVPCVKDNAIVGELRMDDGATLGYQSIRNRREKGIVVLLGGPFKFVTFEQNVETHSHVRHAQRMQDYKDAIRNFVQRNF